MSFLRDLHRQSILRHDETERSYEHLLSEHLRVAATYWGIATLSLLRDLDDAQKIRTAKFIMSCKLKDGSFAANVGHDPHITSTHVSA